MDESISSRIEFLTVRTLIEGMCEGSIVSNHNLIEVGKNIKPIARKDFIESLMAGVPVLPFVIDGTRRPWTLLDGVKRLSLIFAFYQGRFMIEDTPYMSVGGSAYYEELPLFKKRRFLTAKIPCYVINPPTSDAAVNDIKKRMNRPL